MSKASRQVQKAGKSPPYPKQPIPNQEQKNGNGNDKRRPPVHGARNR
jgi:hypothetical protein